MRIKALFAALVLVLALMTGCSRHEEPRTVYSGPTVRVERQGRQTIVHDLAANRRYVITKRRVRKSEIEPGPKTIVSTDNLVITADGGTTIIKTADGVRITITRHRLRR